MSFITFYIFGMVIYYSTAFSHVSGKHFDQMCRLKAFAVTVIWGPGSWVAGFWGPSF